MWQGSSSVSKKIRALTDRAEGILLWVFIVLLLADVLLGILARYVNFEIVFADELGKYFFVWLCAIGISAAARDNQHVRLTFIASRLPLPRKAIWLTSQILFLAFAFFYFFWSLQLTRMHYTMEKSVMGFRFPMYVFTAALPAGFGLTCLRLVQDIIHTITSSSDTIGKPQSEFEEKGS